MVSNQSMSSPPPEAASLGMPSMKTTISRRRSLALVWAQGCSLSGGDDID